MANNGLFQLPAEQPQAQAQDGTADQGLFQLPSLDQNDGLFSLPPGTPKRNELPPVPALPIADTAPLSEDFIDQAKRGFNYGATRALAPFHASQQMIDEKRTWPTLAAEILTDLGVSVAAGGALSAAAGTAAGLAGLGSAAVVGASVAGTLLYATYQGVGSEYLYSKEAGVPFSPQRALVSAALEINPLIEATSRASRIIRSVAQASTAGLLEMSRSGNELNAGVSAVLTAAFMPFAMRISGRSSNPANEIQATLGRLDLQSGAKLLERTEAVFQELPETLKDFKFNHNWTRQVQTSGLGLSLHDFKRFVLGDLTNSLDRKKVAIKFKEMASQPEMQSKIKELWPDFLKMQVMQRVGEAEAAKMTKTLRGTIDPLESRWRRLVADAHFTTSKIDEKMGTDMSGGLDRLHQQLNDYKNIEAGFLRRASELAEETRKLGISDEAIGAMFVGRQKVDPAASSILKKYQQLWDDVREVPRARGFDVGYLEKYLPRRAVAGAKLDRILRHRLAEIENIAAKAKTSDLMDLRGNEKFDEFLAFYKRQFGREPKDQTELRQLISRVEESSTRREKTGRQVSSQFVRDEEMDLPEFVRETAMGKLFTSYLNTNVKTAVIMPAMREYNNNIHLLRRMGATATAQYLEGHLAGIVGVPAGLHALTTSGAERMRQTLYRQADATGIKALDTVADVGIDTLSWLSSQIYPSRLISVSQMVKNAMQIPTFLWPKLGNTGYASSLLMRSLLNLREEAGGSGKLFPYLPRFLQSVGEDAAGQVRDVHRNFDSVASRARMKIDNMNEAAMKWTFGASELFNRAITYKTGQLIAVDAIAGKTNALKIIEDLGPGIANQIRAKGLLSPGKEKELGTALGTALITQTMFRYGPVQQAELMRLAGPLFSQFTKFPFMALGSILHRAGQIRNDPIEGTTRALKTIVAPFALFSAIDSAFETADGVEEETLAGTSVGKIKRFLVEDLADLTPGPAAAGAIEKLTSLEFMPAFYKTLLSGGQGIIEALRDGKYETLDSAALKLIQDTAPGIAPITNEIDRWYKRARKENKLSHQIFINPYDKEPF